MATAIYFLCMLTSVLCAVLLARGYSRARSPLLLTSSVCFALLAIHNLLLVVDMVWLPTEIDLSMTRAAVGAVAIAAMVGGLVWTSAPGGGSGS